MTDLSALIAEMRAEYDAEPAWKRAMWRARAWVWPVRYCRYLHLLRVELPVAFVVYPRKGWFATLHHIDHRWLIVGVHIPLPWWLRKKETDR